MSKFKVGDRVRLLRSSYKEFKVGEIHTLTIPREHSHGISIYHAKFPEGGLFFCDDELELVPMKLEEVYTVAPLQELVDVIKKAAPKGIRTNSAVTTTDGYQGIVFVNETGDPHLDTGTPKYFRNGSYKEVPIHEFLELLKNYKPEFKEIRLNGKIKAVIDKENKVIRTRGYFNFSFPFEQLEQLEHALQPVLLPTFAAHKTTLLPNGDIMVGCQTIDREALNSLFKAIKDE